MENPGAKKQLNQFASYKNRWSESNPTSNIPRVRAVGADEYSSLYVEDGSFLKLKTISLGYNFDAKTLKRIGISAARYSFLLKISLPLRDIPVQILRFLHVTLC